MRRILQIARGLRKDLPQLADGEFGLAMDKKHVYIGAGGDNIPLNPVLMANVTIQVNAATGNDATADGTTAKPYKTITAALDSLPKDLGRNSVYIRPAAGTYDESVSFRDFKNGYINLGSGSVNYTIRGVSFVNCEHVSIYGNLTISGSNSLSIENSDVELLSSAKIIYANTTNWAVSVSDGGRFMGNGTITCTNAMGAVNVSGLSRAYIGILTGTAKTGVRVLSGSIVAMNVYTAFTATTMFDISQGGRIFSNGMTNAPSY